MLPVPGRSRSFAFRGSSLPCSRHYASTHLRVRGFCVFAQRRQGVKAALCKGVALHSRSSACAYFRERANEILCFGVFGERRVSVCADGRRSVLPWQGSVRFPAVPGRAVVLRIEPPRRLALRLPSLTPPRRWRCALRLPSRGMDVANPRRAGLAPLQSAEQAAPDRPTHWVERRGLRSTLRGGAACRPL
jgi:hypothetical protein